MTKLSRHYFSELPKDVQGQVKEEFGENFDPEYFAGDDLNNVDEIIENYDGKPQSASYDFPDYVTPDDEDDTYFYVYFSDMEKYWVEEYGQESWDNVSFEDIDKEIQTNNPELWYAGQGSNDRGKYLAYTTDEKQACK